MCQKRSRRLLNTTSQVTPRLGNAHLFREGICRALIVTAQHHDRSNNPAASNAQRSAAGAHRARAKSPVRGLSVSKAVQRKDANGGSQTINPEDVPAPMF